MSYSKKLITHNHSTSLWNYTLSPGWSDQEVQILKLALMKFGIGRWRKIINSQCLPGKSIGQIYMQTQRLLGQQSLGEFMGLSLDMAKVYMRNMVRRDVFRKNNSIINTGDNMTQEERKRLISENRRLFGIGAGEVQKIVLPRYHVSSQSSFLSLCEIENGKFTTIEKLRHLVNLKSDIGRKINKMDMGELAEEEEEELVTSRRGNKRQKGVIVSLVMVGDNKFRVQ